MYLEGMAASSIFVHVGIIDLTGKVIYVSLKIACCFVFLFVFTLNSFFSVCETD